jgi:predicted PurR-regulated permease PerM
LKQLFSANGSPANGYFHIHDLGGGSLMSLLPWQPVGPGRCLFRNHQGGTNMPEQRPSQMVLKYFLLLFLLSILLMGRLLWPFFSILVLSFLLAGIFQPVYAFINRRFSPGFSSFITCLLIIVLVFVPLMIFVGALSQEAYNLYQMGKTANLGASLKTMLHQNPYLVRAQEMLKGLGISLDPAEASKMLSGLASDAGLFIFKQARSWAANVMIFLFDFFMMILTIYFLLIDQERLIDFFLRLSPLPDEQERQLIDKFKEITGAVLVGNGVCGLIQGVLGGAAMVALGFGKPILWGGVMTILAFLPVFGIGLVLIPAALVLLLQGKAALALATLIFYAALSFSVEYLLKPKLVSRQVQMHTMLVFLAIMGGLSLFGFLGIIYGPLIVSAFLTMTEIYLGNYGRYVTSEDEDKSGAY